MRRISVNSFGYGGTNAHVIVEALPSGSNLSQRADLKFNLPDIWNNFLCNNITRRLDSRTTFSLSPCTDQNSFHQLSSMCSIERKAATFNESKCDSSQLQDDINHELFFPLSANSEDSLLQNLRNLQAYVSTEIGANKLRDIAHTLAHRRSQFPFRRCLIAATQEELLNQLKTVKPQADKKATGTSQVAFIFTGQGAQWTAMGRELLLTRSSFAHSIMKSDSILRTLGSSWSLVEELLLEEADSRVTSSEVGQPATTAIQIALVDLFNSLNLRPCAVLGHSSGEIAAAYATGALSQDAAIRVSFHRGFLAQQSKNRFQNSGAMLSVGLSEIDIIDHLCQVSSGLIEVACLNSPSNTTVSGDRTAVGELEEKLKKLGIFVRRLKVDTAYHSSHMRKVAQDYALALSGLPNEAPKPTTTLISSVTAQMKTADFGAEYWAENLTSKVRFYEALQELHQRQTANAIENQFSRLIYIEIGPHNALAGPIRQVLSNNHPASLEFSYLPTLIRGRNAKRAVLETVASLFEQGCNVKLGPLDDHDESQALVKRQVITNLSPYAWDHTKSYWHESRLSQHHRLFGHPVHELLGHRLNSSTFSEPIWRQIIRAHTHPWLAGHVINGLVTFPASGYICMAVEAMKQIAQDRKIRERVSSYVLRGLSFSKALVIENASIELQLSFQHCEYDDVTDVLCYNFRVVSVSTDGSCIEHCCGSITAELLPSCHGCDDDTIIGSDFLPYVQDRGTQHSTSEEDELMDRDSVYRKLASRGNCYNSFFASIQTLSIGRHYSLGSVSIPDISLEMPSNFGQPYVIHPSTLDALIHSSLPKLIRECDTESILTVSIRELVISSLVETQMGTQLHFCTSLKIRHRDFATADISAYQGGDENTRLPLIQISGVNLRGSRRIDRDRLDTGLNADLTYQMKFDIDVDCEARNLSVTLESPKYQSTQSLEAKLRLLDTAASLYVDRFLQKLDKTPVTEQRHFHWILFIDWMRRYRESPESQVLTRGLPPEEEDSCLDQVQNATGVECEMLHRIGLQLEALMLGTLDPLTLMLENDLLYRLYNDDASTACYGHMARYLKSLIHKRPQVKILEIGGGTGGATLALLQALGHDRDVALAIASYDFTDVSSGFFDRARVLLEPWHNILRYGTLDLEIDFQEQGFVKGGYDLVIASNALHVVKDIEGTLRRIRELLNDEGRLLMIESTRTVPFYNVMFGPLAEWWIGRPIVPLRTSVTDENRLRSRSQGLSIPFRR